MTQLEPLESTFNQILRSAYELLHFTGYKILYIYHTDVYTKILLQSINIMDMFLNCDKSAVELQMSGWPCSSHLGLLILIPGITGEQNGQLVFHSELQERIYNCIPASVNLHMAPCQDIRGRHIYIYIRHNTKDVEINVLAQNCCTLEHKHGTYYIYIYIYIIYIYIYIYIYIIYIYIYCC